VSLGAAASARELARPGLGPELGAAASASDAARPRGWRDLASGGLRAWVCAEVCATGVCVSLRWPWGFP